MMRDGIPGDGVSAMWPWRCRGCGGPVTRRAIGRTPFHCCDRCRYAAWRDAAAGITGAELAVRQAKRRDARSQELPRFTPGERAVLRQAWMVALAGRYAGCGEPGPAVIEAIGSAVAAGCWPGDDELSGAVTAAVLADLAERTIRKDTRSRRPAA